MKKFLSILLAALMLLGAASASALELSAPGEFPLVKEPATLTIGLSRNALTVDYDDNYLTKYIEDRTGVDIEFYFFPSDGAEAKQKLSLMVAANEELPDIIWMSLDDVTRTQYGQSGIFLPLNQYFDDEAFTHYWDIAMTNYATEEQRNTVVSNAYSYDGNMYGYPQFAYATFDTCATGMLINKQWLENLGLEMPKTTDEFYNVLKAFKEQDPNGNGKADEIPLIGCVGGYYTDLRLALMNAFVYDGYLLNSDNQMEVVDGKLSAPFVTDAYREGLRFMAKLVKEGLLSPMSFSQSQNELIAIMSAPDDQDTLAGVVAGTSTILFKPVDQVKRAYEYAVLEPLTGPEGVCWAPYTGVKGSYNVYITKDCENPDLAYRFLDAMGELDMTMTMRYGEKDVDWKYTTEGRIAHWRLEGYKTIYTTTPTAERPMPWSSEDSIIWHGNFANMLPPALIDGGVRVYNNELQEYTTDILGFAATPTKINKHPANIAYKINYTEEEQEQISEIKNSVNTYVDECYTRFILGDLDVEADWDAYLAELEGMGLSYYMEVAQGAYDRAQANAGK